VFTHSINRQIDEKIKIKILVGVYSLYFQRKKKTELANVEQGTEHIFFDLWLELIVLFKLKFVYV
jgi:hypothetical protein